MAILAGLFLGIAAAVPVGPIGILAVTQHCRYGFRRGYSGALASSAMEIVYSLIAVQAAGFVNAFILKYSNVMKFAGTAVLVFVGVGIFRQARTLCWVSGSIRGRLPASGSPFGLQSSASKKNTNSWRPLTVLAPS